MCIQCGRKLAFNYIFIHFYLLLYTPLSSQRIHLTSFPSYPHYHPRIRKASWDWTPNFAENLNLIKSFTVAAFNNKICLQQCCQRRQRFYYNFCHFWLLFIDLVPILAERRDQCHRVRLFDFTKRSATNFHFNYECVWCGREMLIGPSYRPRISRCSIRFASILI